MRWLPLFLIFLLVYIEISLFIKVAAVLGVLTTLLLVLFTSCVGVSLVRNQGVKTFVQMQQKLAVGESPAAEMVKSVSLVLAGFLLLIPGFFTDFLGLLLLLPPVQKLLTLKLMPHLSIYRSNGWGQSGGAANGNTFEGEFQRKNDERYTLDHRPDDHDKPEDR
ncbi:membrane protein FxsA [Serratia sp. S1B]|nr:membrane protein FxsA [Serratia sp. S1B]